MFFLSFDDTRKMISRKKKKRLNIQMYCPEENKTNLEKYI